MVEALVISYLNSELSCGVFAEVPEDAPSKFVIVQKTGSRRANRLDSATFALQSYAPSKYEAAELNESVKCAMDGIVELAEVSSSKLDGDYDFTDASTKRCRYQAVYRITHY